MVLQGPSLHAMLPELLRDQDTVRFDSEAQRSKEKQLAQTLIVRLLKTQLFYTDP